MCLEHDKSNSLYAIVDVMVLNDIIEQAAGRQSRADDHGGKYTQSRRMPEISSNSKQCIE